MSIFEPVAGQRWLFCMTHPDDEISICIWMQRLVLSGADVYVNWTHSTPIREKEARAVADILGVPQQNLSFMQGRDGSVCEELTYLQPAFCELIEAIGPDRVVCGAFEQGHLDHDSTNYLVNRAYSGQVIEVPLYHTYLTRLQRLNRFADPAGEEAITLLPHECALKKRIAKMYPSQNIWRVLLSYEVWQLLQFRAPSLAHKERLRVQTHTDFDTPNLPEKLANQVRESGSWKRWLRSWEQAELAAKPARVPVT